MIERTWSIDQLESEEISKKDIIEFLHTNASNSFLIENKLNGKLQNVAKVSKKPALITAYNLLFETECFRAENEEEISAAKKEKPRAEVVKAAPEKVVEEVKEVPKFKKTVNKKGNNTLFPKKGDMVSVLYKGTFEDGKVFDSNIDKKGKSKPLRFKVGTGRVIRGWDEGLMTMSVGEKATLRIESDWACDPVIGAEKEEYNLVLEDTIGKKFAADEPVNQEVDFKRRFDFMQQHSGQHLLSAILENKYGAETVSWELGKKRSFVELKVSGGNKITEQVLESVERECNEAIVAGVEVKIEIKDSEKEERPESMPEDYVGGVVRFINIKGIDRNPCCGTHVERLSDLQILKLGVAESGRSGNVKVPFWVGQRVNDYLGSSILIEKQLNILLSTGPELYVDAVKRLLQNQRENLKTIKGLLIEIAAQEACTLANQIKAQIDAQNASGSENNKIVAKLHRADGTLDFILTVSNKATAELAGVLGAGRQTQVAVVVSAGSDKTGGPIIVFGNSAELIGETVEKLKDHFPELKGGGKPTRWQGKSAHWKGREAAFQSL
ncbi:Peptidyl-prolyl cis-trans isomerase FKBP3 [Smittium culicis]|uniref:peptidylprolyl isomerase n=1 Tax=Smittium culicis TaxID=133412 RepID=A0A1R1YJP2_9FUNG|nr:Peptidyl-prolyl cis-trans isomerase FKBP3 [Smittium culicis]